RLGVWQLDRAEQKLALQAAVDAEAGRPALANGELGSGRPLHRRVQLRGHWVAERSVWLDNRPMDGQAGYFVVTPLRRTGRSEAILVQRGWVPRDPRDRTRLP
ncbi:SURF1 family protein, partial [Acinetobacter baumannii]